MKLTTPESQNSMSYFYILGIFYIYIVEIEKINSREILSRQNRDVKHPQIK